MGCWEQKDQCVVFFPNVTREQIGLLYRSHNCFSSFQGNRYLLCIGVMLLDLLCYCCHLSRVFYPIPGEAPVKLLFRFTMDAMINSSFSKFIIAVMHIEKECIAQIQRHFD